MAGKVKRGGLWHMRMVVPIRYASLELPKEIHRSLKTGDEKEADARLVVMEHQIMAELDARLVGQKPGGLGHFESIAALASSRRWGYKTAAELAEGPLDEILRRVADLLGARDSPGSLASAAALGGIERPRFRISEVANLMNEWFAEEVRDKDHTQTRTWTYRWKRPASKVVELLGHDPVFSEINRAQAVSLRDALKDRVIEGDMLGKSAQKELRNLALLWKKFHIHLGIDEMLIPSCPFSGLAQRLDLLDEDTQKLEIPGDCLDRIVTPGVLDSIKPDTRDVTYVLSETGCRQSEITGLPPASIHLDGPVPYIEIKREVGEFAREIKNKSSRRNIPLVGVALEAMQRNPDGFPRFRGKGSFSAEANRALHDLNLLPDDVTIGGMRHTFESRLRAVHVRNDHIAELMGHSVKIARGREVYGNMMDLHAKLEYHHLIQLRPQPGQQ